MHCAGIGGSGLRREVREGTPSWHSPPQIFDNRLILKPDCPAFGGLAQWLLPAQVAAIPSVHFQPTLKQHVRLRRSSKPGFQSSLVAADDSAAPFGLGRGMAAVAATGLMPPNVRRVLARRAAAAARLRDIKHVVLLMQENRSFDHYFGTMAGVRGFDDAERAEACRTANRSSTSPTRRIPTATCCRSIWTRRTTSAQKIPSTSHAWDVQHDAWNGGKMDNWLPAHRKADGDKAPYVMGYHTRDGHPLSIRPGRGVHHLRRLPLLGAGPDLAEPHVLDDRHDRPRRRARRPDDRATRRSPAGSAGRPTPSGWRRRASVGRSISSRTTTAATCWRTSRASRRPTATRRCISAGMVREPEGKFEHDAMQRQPAGRFLDHPHQHRSREHPDYMPAAGAAFVASKIDAIAANPEVWAKTAFILNYDENDGIFDHVAAAGAAARHAAASSSSGVPIGARLSRAVHHRFALDGRRLGVQPAVRPHVGAAVPGKIHRRRRAEHHRVAAQDLRRPDVGLSLRRAGRRASAAIARNGQCAGRAKREVAVLPKPILPGADQRLPIQEKGDRKRTPRIA